MDLFADIEARNRERHLPLAARMRPGSIDEFAGQRHFLGEGKLLRRMLLADRITSVIFYGPPGTGKTTLAHLIAKYTQAHFVELNAAECGVKEVRQVIDAARDRMAADGRRTLLFLDEIHRFNKSQQDVLLPHVEDGTIVLIGATTQNPFFSINAPLVSRSQIFQFEALTADEIKTLVMRAVRDPERGFGKLDIDLRDEAIEHWANVSDGDARRALTALEIAVKSFPVGAPIMIDRQIAEESIQRKAIVYDGTGDAHYDLASAFIKSVRGSDPDAAIYWLARMLEGGEEPRFIARRLVILASEDIGCADSTALVVAMAAAQAVEFIGLPECQLTLAHATIRLAMAPKSNASMKALAAAKKDVAAGRTIPVPAALRDSHYKGSSRLGSGEGYLYSHDYEGGYVEQEYLPSGAIYYEPTGRGGEAAIKELLEKRRAEGSQPQHEQAKEPPA